VVNAKLSVCRTLNISRNPLALWLKREEKMGDCRAITAFEKGSGHKITDWDSFGEFAKKHGDKT